MTTLFTTCLSLSALLMLAALLGAVRIARSRKKHRFTPFRLFFVGATLAVYLAWLPFTAQEVAGSGNGPALRLLQTLIFTLHRNGKMFSLGLDAGDINGVPAALGGLRTLYVSYMTLLSLICPLMSIGLVLSFFQNLWARLRFALRPGADAYVFSALNARSLALARDVADSDARALIAFCGVTGKSPLAREAAILGAAAFSRDMASLGFLARRRRGALYLFAIGEGDGENVRLGLTMLERCAGLDNAALYVFDRQPAGELMLANRIGGMTSGDRTPRIRVHRIDEDQTLAFNELYEHGVETVFNRAAPAPDGTRAINAVIVGASHAGGEMLRALTWYCQMDGYALRIDAIDPDPECERRFAARCPGLVDPAINGRSIPGEEAHTLRFHPGVDPDSADFAEVVAQLSDATCAYVDLGDDDANVRAAVALRALFRRAGAAPVIRAVVHDPEKAAALEGFRNFRGDGYDIGLIGDLKRLYRRQAIFASKLDGLARLIHDQWAHGAADDAGFRLSGYDYRSSLASALHKAAWCALKPIDPEHISEAELQSLGEAEHRRWNAYMRSEGFVFDAGDGKDYIARTHCDLTDFGALMRRHPEEILKDARIGAEGLRYVWQATRDRRHGRTGA